ncbi:MAG: hypothetical protein MZV64_49220 [Ignavibacteriales bacterium]|nr:hypothetical protein [Ignavibacteriales bacterium]
MPRESSSIRTPVSRRIPCSAFITAPGGITWSSVPAIASNRGAISRSRWSRCARFGMRPRKALNHCPSVCTSSQCFSRCDISLPSVLRHTVSSAPLRPRGPGSAAMDQIQHRARHSRRRTSHPGCR